MRKTRTLPVVMFILALVLVVGTLPAAAAGKPVSAEPMERMLIEYAPGKARQCASTGRWPSPTPVTI